jgi:hypothetical protein
MALLKVFKSNIPSINYIFPWGKVAAFQFGVYRTDLEDEVKHLEAEVKLNHPHIFIDEAEREIDSAMVDPIHALRAKIIAEYEASRARAENPDQDMGASDQSPVKPSNSRDVAVAMAGGSGAPTKFELPGTKKSA